MRVVMVVTGFPSSDDAGTGIFNLRAAQAISRYANVTVIHLRSWRPSRPVRRSEVVEGVPVVRLALPRAPLFERASFEWYKAAAWPLVRSSILTCNIIHSVGFSFASLVAAHWARMASVHHVAQITSELELNCRSPRPNKRTLAFVHAAACNSKALAKTFRGMHPSVPNVRAIYRGVDLERFKAGSARSNASTQSGVRFLYLGGFPTYRTKGGETLLAAWQSVETELANASAELTVAGPRSTSAEVRRWVSGLRFPERVHVEGSIDPSRVAETIAACDAVLVPSLQEGFPNVVGEAFACGRPVIASALDCIAELVTDGETGVLLPPGDAKAWSTGLKRMARRRGDLLRFGRQARDCAEQLFDARAFPTNIVALYGCAMREPLKERQALPWTALF